MGLHMEVDQAIWVAASKQSVLGILNQGGRQILRNGVAFLRGHRDFLISEQAGWVGRPEMRRSFLRDALKSALRLGSCVNSGGL